PAGPAAPVAEPLAILFPPDGAEVELSSNRLSVRARGGTAPYTWLLDGRPVVIGSPAPVADLPVRPGYGQLSVIDAAGRTSRAAVRLRGVN
ncbi:MAG TPA: penicillin-binding protein 1C, partial [Paracoccus sp. (in: a-proteobacteria)]|nr:penicillin-binding protein 1C [Paracoccus sp. (in: a-proteobacteria)]